MEAVRILIITLSFSLIPSTFSVLAQETSSEDSDIDFFLSGSGDIDLSGNEFVVTSPDLYRVFKISPDGVVSVFAGTGRQREYGTRPGEGGPASEALLGLPRGIAVDSKDDVYIADRHIIRKVDSNGIITTVAGSGGPWSRTIDPVGEPAVEFGLGWTTGLEFDPRPDKLYIMEDNNQIWRVEKGRIFHHSGNGETGCRGDGGPPLEAQFNSASDMVVGPDGSLYIADKLNYRIRKITPDGLGITTVVGNGRWSGGRIPTGTPAVRASIRDVDGLAFDSAGRLYYMEDDAGIYRLERKGTLTLFADLSGFPGGSPRGTIIFDAAGRLIVADFEHSRILEVSADGQRVRTLVRGKRLQQQSLTRAAQHLIGGNDVEQGDWPFVARVETSGVSCTGSLIAPNWILTAAHCLFDSDGLPAEPSEISVFLGRDLDGLVCENLTEKIGRIYIHPGYEVHGAGLINDAALIEVLEPFRVEPVQLSTPEDEAKYARSGTAATVVGWGRLGDGNSARVLQQISVPLWTPEDCQKRSRWKSGVVHERTLCSGGVRDRATALGDSGAPLLVPSPEGWLQVGINSMGPGGLHDAVDFPSVHTRTSSIHDWIRKQIVDELHFAHFGVGEGLTSDVVLLNPSGQRSVSGEVHFFDSKGKKLEPSTLMLADDPQFALEPLGSLAISPESNNVLVTGSLLVTSQGPVSGFIRFRLEGIGMTGIGASTLSTRFIAPLHGGGIRTGVAIRNTEDEPVLVSLALVDGNGEMVSSSDEIEIPGQGQISRFIDEYISAFDPEFKGSVIIESQDGEIAVIALELGSNVGEFATLPVAVAD